MKIILGKTLYLVGGWFLFPFLVLTGLLRVTFETLEDKLWDIKGEWKIGCRRIMGLTDDGKTPEQVAEAERKRQQTLKELNEGIEKLRREREECEMSGSDN